MDMNKIITGITQSGLASGLAGGVAGGAVTSALMSKKGRKYASTALKVGGLAAVGGLAWKAFTSYRDQQQGESAAAGEAASVAAVPSAAGDPPRRRLVHQTATVVGDTNSSGDSKGLLVLRAMIAAAYADGHIDADERQRIFARVDTLELSGEEKALLFDELSQPASIERLASSVGDMETGVEVYTASLLAIDSTCRQGDLYLQGLAARLDLPPPLVSEIHARVMAPDVAA